MQGIPDKNLPFERFLDSLDEACLVVTLDGRIVASNTAARALHGAGDRSLLGHALEQARIEDEVRAGENAREQDLDLPRLLLESALDGILAHTLDGDLIYANTAAQVQWGMSVGTARKRGKWGWIDPLSRESVMRSIEELTATGRVRFVAPGSPSDGRPTHVEVHARLVDGPDGPVVVSTLRDVSERIQTEEMVRYMAYHDDLTGLANRTLLQQELFHAASMAERHGDVVGVAFIDLDRFKPVNDTYGHATGDDVLREVADRISGCVRDGDTVARVGGDEFVVVLPRLSCESDLDVVAAKLCREISLPIEVRGGQVTITASVGTALHRPGDDPETLLNRADLGMYESRGVCVDGEIDRNM